MMDRNAAKTIAVVGAGFSGAVIANQLAESGHRVVVLEARSHVAGNCHTERDDSSGIMVHVYGPHIFHTDSEMVWNFVNKFDDFLPYENRVKATTGNRVYSLPINLLTINQFFGLTLSPTEARKYIESIGDISIKNPRSFEEWALRFLGRELYSAFFEGYTLKQWGTHPSKLPADIIKRLPVSFNYDDRYFHHRYQGIPRNGYTKIVEQLLDSSNIDLHLGESVGPEITKEFDHIFYSGPIDGWFSYQLGLLDYRTLDFERIDNEGDYQGCAVMNYCEAHIPWTRISEHKHFAPWESHEKTICFREYSRRHEPGDIPYYPIRLLQEKEVLAKYIDLAQQEKNVTFVGRLGTYRYLDMDITIKEAIEVAQRFLDCHSSGLPMPAFHVDPLQ